MTRDIYILGVHPATTFFSSHDPSVCLVHNGKVVAAVEEERFVRKKHAIRCFPINSIKFCLDYAGIKFEDLTKIALPVSPKYYEFTKSNFSYLKGLSKTGNLIRYYHCMDHFRQTAFKNAAKIRKEIETEISSYLKNEFTGVDIKKFDFISHHRCHAASAFYPSGFKKASTITMDGVGEGGKHESTVLWNTDGSEFKRIKVFNFPNSLGLYYLLFCIHLGFDALDGPGKVMGLSSYGTYSNDVSPLFRSRLKTKDTYDVTRFASRFFMRRFGKPRKKGEKLTKKHQNIAFMLQRTLEEMALRLVNENYMYTQSKNLCLAGGTAMNCVMNGYLLRTENVKDIFIQPAASDNGVSIGAALEAYAGLGYKPRSKFDSVYLGPKFDDEQIKESINRKGLKKGENYEYCKDIAGATADLLAKNKVVGWFQGRMELGARGLGARSLLANPCDKNAKDIVNAKVKHREMWRPFCPSLTYEAMNKYLEDAYESPFMNLAFYVKEDQRKEIPSVVHVDGTTRPQTVRKGINPLYHKMLKELESHTGHPVVLNTSLNVAGEPIVCRPDEAINDLLTTGMDYLAIGNYLVKK